MKDLKSDVLRTLIYFDIFSFPMRLEEVHRFCQTRTQTENIAGALAELETEGRVFRFGQFYAVRREEGLVRRREANYRHSSRKMSRARRNARLIGQFPFVRAVAISGSLSKYSADADSDIDYFIITDTSRLWICRTLLHLFKKLTFLVGRQHDFCMNYFLDENELELKDKNIFTAVESTTIIPVYGSEGHRKFYHSNAWVYRFLPNQRPEKLNGSMADCKGWLKQLCEQLLGGKWGDGCNRVFKKMTMRRWRRKYAKQGYPMEYFDHDFRATTGESKNHPFDYQRHVLERYRDRVQSFSLIAPES